MFEPFTLIEDSLCILRSGGVSRQTTLYRRGKHIYAKYGSGYVRLFKHGTTSVPKLSWIDFDLGELDLDETVPNELRWQPKKTKRMKPVAAE